MAIKRSPPEDIEVLMHQGTQWIIVYGDLMSYLMIFFLMLFVFTSSKQSMTGSLQSIEESFGKKERKMTEEAFRETQVYNDIQTFVVAQGLTHVARVVLNEQKLKVVLTSPVLFPSGSAELHRKAYGILHLIAEQVKNISNRISIEGFTDDQPIQSAKYQSNWELSAARAMQLVKYFVDEEKISPSRISFTGYGEYQPEYANDSEEHRALNRRIEIVIHRILLPYKAGAQQGTAGKGTRG